LRNAALNNVFYRQSGATSDSSGIAASTLVHKFPIRPSLKKLSSSRLAYSVNCHITAFFDSYNAYNGSMEVLNAGIKGIYGKFPFFHHHHHYYYYYYYYHGPG
jgi:hypothetical protein